MPFFAGLGVREKANVWPLCRLVGIGGGSSCFRGEPAREEAKLDATMALASSSPVVRGVMRRGCIWRYAAAID